jgi:hypothetical protein
MLASWTSHPNQSTSTSEVESEAKSPSRLITSEYGTETDSVTEYGTSGSDKTLWVGYGMVFPMRGSRGLYPRERYGVLCDVGEPSLSETWSEISFSLVRIKCRVMACRFAC